MEDVTDTLKVIGKDAAGYEILTEAMKYLLNQFPLLLEDENVKFEELEEDSGIAFSNESGSLVYLEKEDIIGGVHQECQYPFYIVYRAASSARERQKLRISEFLDLFGKWLCGETIYIEETPSKLTEYPDLSSGREIKRIARDNSYGLEPQENGIQDWLLPITVSYTNEFFRN